LFAVVLDDLGQTKPILFRLCPHLHPRAYSSDHYDHETGREAFPRSPFRHHAAGTASDNIGLDHVEFQVSSGPFLSVTALVVKADAPRLVGGIPLAPGNKP